MSLICRFLKILNINDFYTHFKFDLKIIFKIMQIDLFFCVWWCWQTACQLGCARHWMHRLSDNVLRSAGAAAGVRCY